MFKIEPEIQSIIEKIINKGVSEYYDGFIQYSGHTDLIMKRIEKIKKLMEDNVKHTLVFHEYGADMSGQPATPVKTTRFTFLNGKYVEGEISVGEEIIVYCELY